MGPGCLKGFQQVSRQSWKRGHWDRGLKDGIRWSLLSHYVFPTTCRLAIGYDEGTIVIKLGQEVPLASMDATGKLRQTAPLWLSYV